MIPTRSATRTLRRRESTVPPNARAPRRSKEEDQPVPHGHGEPPRLEISPEDRAKIDVLIVDDEPALVESCASLLRAEGYRVTTCVRGGEAVALIQRRRFDVALIDLYMVQVSGLELLEACLATNPDMLVIMITGNPSVDTSLEALRRGAWQYLPKPFPATHLQIVMARATHTLLIAREVEPDEPTAGDDSDEGIAVVGEAPAIRKAMAMARKVAATDASVFITGESGTGKELIAQYIHRHSRRRSRPMVAVNCAALPESLLESEMFGHVKGAFTGAVRDKPGLLETANGGTLFLDELTEMPVSIQAKLLRVIQDGVVRRVGSNSTDAVVNVRFIAATNRNPREATEDGSLRTDLYYRLRVVPLHIPPLRQRVEDIPLLARHFLEVFWARHRDRRSRPPTLSQEAIRALQTWPWLGNVRQLQNVIEHTAVLAEPGAEILPQDIPFADDSWEPATQGSIRAVIANEPRYHAARERVIVEFERSYLEWLINRTLGNISKAARIAGVDRTTLYRLLEKHGLARESIIGGGPSR